MFKVDGYATLTFYCSMSENQTLTDDSADDEQYSHEPNGGPVRTIPPNESQYAGYSAAFAARIGDRDLWIANSGGVKPDSLKKLNLDPEHVISLNRTPTGATTDYHPLRDAYLNDQREFVEAVKTARKRYRQSGQTIINCAAGISRSATVIATTIAAEEELSFDAAVSEIKETRPKADPHPKLRLSALSYLANVTDSTDHREQLENLASQVYAGREDEETVDELLDKKTERDTGGCANKTRGDFE